MSREVLSWGPEEKRPREKLRPLWTLRRDRTTLGLAAAVAALLLGGASAADRPGPASSPTSRVAMRTPADLAISSATATVEVDGAVVVAPVVRPNRRTARRAAELVTARQCRNIERARYRRIDPAADSEDGRTATFVIGRASDTPRKSAGFVLRLAWREGEYVGQVSEAYGGCARG